MTPPPWLADLCRRAGATMNGSDPWDPQIHDSRFFQRAARDGSLGVGESYVEGWWDCEAIDELACRVLRSTAVDAIPRTPALLLAELKGRIGNMQTGQRGAAVARKHYDLSVDLFAAMLGRTMAYSCGYWAQANTLDEAQEAKLELICRKLHLSRNHRILDIGCGWGSFVRYAAARYGCHAVGITNSGQQAAYATRWCSDLPVVIAHMDYRSPDLAALGPFHRVVSVGMLEHVGHKNLRRFMRVARRVLRPDGLFLLHSMGRTVDTQIDLWIDRYIFPNSYLPTTDDLAKAMNDVFIMEDWHNFGADYDRTLMAWHANFERYASERRLPKSDPYYRMWRYYLLTFAGCFRARTRVQLWQIAASPEGIPGGYRSVR